MRGAIAPVASLRFASTSAPGGEEKRENHWNELVERMKQAAISESADETTPSSKEAEAAKVPIEEEAPKERREQNETKKLRNLLRPNCDPDPETQRANRRKPRFAKVVKVRKRVPDKQRSSSAREVDDANNKPVFAKVDEKQSENASSASAEANQKIAIAEDIVRNTMGPGKDDTPSSAPSNDDSPSIWKRMLAGMRKQKSVEETIDTPIQNRSSTVEAESTPSRKRNIALDDEESFESLRAEVAELKRLRIKEVAELNRRVEVLENSYKRYTNTANKHYNKISLNKEGIEKLDKTVKKLEKWSKMQYDAFQGIFK